MRARPRGAVDRPAGADAVAACAGDAQALSRAVRDHGREEDVSPSPPPPAATPRTAPPSSSSPNASSAPRSKCCPAAREAELTALGVISGVHRADGVVGDLGGGSLELVDVRGTRARARRDPAARRPGARRHFGEVAEEGGEVRQEDADRPAGAQGLRGPHLLCGRRHLALAGAAAHVADRLSAARDARLCDPRRRSARIRQAGAPGRRRNAVQHRSRRQCAAAAAALCGAGARIHHARRQAAAGRVLGARRARGPALFAAQAEGQGEGRADRSGAPSQPVALALAAPRRGADRLDRPLHGDRRASRRPARSAGCATPRACSPISAGARIPIIAASNRSTSSPTAAFRRSIIRAAPISRWRCSSAMSGWSWTTNCRRGCANWSRRGMLDRARVLGAALRLAYVVSAAMPGVLDRDLARRRAAPAGAAPAGRITRRWPASACSNRLRSLARLIGREPVMLMG